MRPTPAPTHRFGRHDRPRPVAGRDRRARRVAARRTTSGGRPSSGRSSGRSSAPRAGATAARPGRGAGGRAAPLFLRYGGHAGAAGFEIATERWPEFVEQFGALAAADGARPTRGGRSRSTWRCRRSTSTTPSSGASPASRRAASATRSRSSRCSGLTVTRSPRSDRRPHPAHAQARPRRPRRDRVRPAGPGRDRRRGRPGRRRRPGSSSRTFGGFESLQLEIRDVADVRSARRGGRDPRRLPAAAPPTRPRPAAIARSAGVTRARATAPPRDPYGIGPARPYIGPALALIALVVIGAITLGLMNGQLPFRSATRRQRERQRRRPGPDAGAVERGHRRAGGAFPGTIVYAKAGNIWLQSGNRRPAADDPAATRCRRSRRTARTSTSSARGPARRSTPAAASTPGSTCRPRSSSASRRTAPRDPVQVVNGRIQRRQRHAGSTGCASRRSHPNGHDDRGRRPTGRTRARATSSSRPATPTTGKFTQARDAESALGHQDPAWAPDGTLPRVRQERPGRRARHAPDPQVEPGERPRLHDHRPRLHRAGLVAGQQVPRRDEDRQLRDRRRDPRRDHRRGAAPADERRPLVLAGLVAGRRRDRVPPPRRRDRRPRPGQARRHAGPVDGRRGDAPDRGLRARCRVAAGLVHPAVGAAGARRPPTPTPSPAAPASTAP